VPTVFLFVLLVVLLQSGSYEFSNARAAMVSPLAKKLFSIDGVTGEHALACQACTPLEGATQRLSIPRD
jgi:hypothetical protein